jgi:hypothetical protein
MLLIKYSHDTSNLRTLHREALNSPKIATGDIIIANINHQTCTSCPIIYQQLLYIGAIIFYVHVYAIDYSVPQEYLMHPFIRDKVC